MFSSNFDSKISNEPETGDNRDREHGKICEESECEDATGNSDGRKQQMSDERKNDKTSDDICDKNEKDSSLFDDNHRQAFFAELEEITKTCKVPVENGQWGYLFSDSEEDEDPGDDNGNDEDENDEMTGDDEETTDSEFYDTDLDEPPPKSSAEGQYIVFI